jgi:multidrug efflux pump subunit AcrA (membrane-fusion protein)
MNQHLQKIIADIKDLFVQGKDWFLELSRIKQALVIIITLLIVSTIGRALLRDSEVQEIKNLPRAVTLASVSELSAKSSLVPLLGTVTSRSEATVRAETGGQLRVVYKRLGDYVVAGQIIAEFENSGERASVTAAEGGYEQAKAARDIARINKGSSDTGLVEAKTSALNTLASTYNTLDDAIRVKSDSLFSNPDNDNIEFLPTVPDQALTLKIVRTRTALEKVLTARAERNKVVTQDTDLINELTTLETETKQIKAYLDDVASALSKAIPNGAYTQTVLDGAKVSVNIARSSVSGSLSSITGSRSALNASIASSQIAKTNYGDGTSASSASADAQVKSALGNYQGALARLEKTIVRSPISGTLNSLSVETGDYIAPYTEIGVVSNNGALEILAYGTEEDARQIEAGAKVTIENGATGIVTKIASALDPKTKKIEVRIGITSGAKGLVNGQSARVEIARPNALVQSASTKIEIPIAALKITPQGSFVFTVDKESASSTEGTLVAHQVTEGALLGDKIQILEGVTSDMVIVTDARGLKEGKTVTIK